MTNPAITKSVDRSVDDLHIDLVGHLACVEGAARYDWRETRRMTEIIGTDRSARDITLGELRDALAKVRTERDQ